MSSPTVSATNTDRDRARIRTTKKKKKQSHKQSISEQQQQQQNWKSQSQQQIYSSKLIKALRHVSTGSASAPRKSRAVRDAAERALADTAKGRSRWSRAILTSRLKLKLNLRKRNNNNNNRARVLTGNSRSPKKTRVSVYRLKGKNLPAVQRRVTVLSRLVPGCRKQSFPVILEEAYDYIEAKHMQIRAMTELIHRFAGTFSASSSSFNSINN